LSAFENGGRRAFDISDASALEPQDYEGLEPFQWPLRKGQAPVQRLFAEGGFFTPDRRAQFIPIAAPRLAVAVSQDWPLVLNSGRIRDQWHTMTRTGLSPRLASHIGEPFVEIHPDDARRVGLEQGMLARVSTAHGDARLRVLVSRNQQPGTLFVPIHWSSENSSDARIGAMVHSVTDPVSGQPESKATPARIEPLAVSHYGFALSREPFARADMAYWSKARTTFGHMLVFALDSPLMDWPTWHRGLLPAGDRLEFSDAAAGSFRAAVLRGGRLEGIVIAGATPKLPSLDWLKSQFERDIIPSGERRGLLAARPAEGAADEGPIVCVCFQVGQRAIEAAAASGCRTVEAVGKALGAGTNCGSCVPELRRLIAASTPVREREHEPA
jgi:assimilatory nitrate reductase catalytic subunit